MLKISLRLFYRYSNINKNFFEINPIFPDYGQKDFDLYNTPRKRISVIQAVQKINSRKQQLKSKIKQKIINKGNKKRFKQKIDPETGFLITQNTQLNQYINQFKKNKKIASNLQTKFDQVLTNLIKKFKVKSQAQLIRLMRISIANSNKNSLKDQIRGKLMKQALLKVVTNYNKQQNNMLNQIDIEIDQNQIDQKAFQQALKQIDEKIIKIEKGLKYHSSGAKKSLNKFDIDYGYQPIDKFTPNQNHSLITDKGYQGFRILQSVPPLKNIQDWSIKRRISRLYFLERLKYVSQGNKSQQIKLKFPIPLKGANKIINQLAIKYKEEELQQIPDLEDIYSDIDIVLDKVNVKISTSKQPDNSQVQTRNIINQHVFNREELLWRSIDAEKVFAPEPQLPPLTQTQILALSPNSDAELSLNRIPFNLYRHSQYQIFGVFNKYKSFILQNLIKAQTVEIQDQFRQFSLNDARNFKKEFKIIPAIKNKFVGYAKRKSSRAKAILSEGIGKITINNVSLRDYFGDSYHRTQALKPLIYTESAGKYDIQFYVMGGGLTSQCQCCAYALTRSLLKIYPDKKDILYNFGMVGFDSRVKQVKRIGLYSARVRPPYVRR